MKFTLIIMLLSLGLLAGGMVIVTKANSTIDVQVGSNVKAVVSTTEYDWGTININDGKVAATFTVKNEGTEDLKLYKPSTSCSCTSVQLKQGNTASALYSMYQKTNFVLTIPPNQTGEIEVVFDPAFHGPDAVGPIDRQVKVQTNDPALPSINLQTKANVVK